MTVLEAIRAKIPLAMSDEALMLLLLQQGLDASEEYDPAKHSSLITQAAVDGLYQQSTVIKEKDNGSEVQYSANAINVLIKRYENDLKQDKVKTIGACRDITSYW